EGCLLGLFRISEDRLGIDRGFDGKDVWRGKRGRIRDIEQGNIGPEFRGELRRCLCGMGRVLRAVRANQNLAKHRWLLCRSTRHMRIIYANEWTLSDIWFIGAPVPAICVLFRGITGIVTEVEEHPERNGLSRTSASTTMT